MPRKRGAPPTRDAVPVTRHPSSAVAGAATGRDRRAGQQRQDAEQQEAMAAMSVHAFIIGRFPAACKPA